MKKSPLNKRKALAAKEPVAKRKTPTPLEGPDQSFQVIAHALKDIPEREHEREGLIQALCKRLGNVQSEGLLEVVDDLPKQKKVDELEAKTAFLLEKASKSSTELKEVKEDHKKALDKLNVALAFNQKLEAYVGHTGDVVNKARLFDANLAKNPITAGKIIPVLVDFAEKMEEFLDKMRVFFDGLQPEMPPIAGENLPNILGEIPSLTGWGKKAATETLTKPDQPGPSEPTREEEIETRSELPTSPRTRTIKTAPAPREVQVNTIVTKVIRELEEEESQAYGVDTTPQPARIDTVQTKPEEPAAEWMRELSTPPSGPTPEPISVATPSVPLFPQPARQDNPESLQDSRTDPKPPTSGIITNSREYQPGYTRQTGSIRES